jgi:hypothetical protein
MMELAVVMREFLLGLLGFRILDRERFDTLARRRAVTKAREISVRMQTGAAGAIDTVQRTAEPAIHEERFNNPC